MPDALNRQRSTRWRELVCLTLRAELGREYPLRTRPVVTSLAKAFAEQDPERGDVQGLNRWLINTRADLKYDWASALDEVERDRLADGKELAALVQHRVGKPAAEGFAVLRLDQLATLIRETS